jgi:hypothetical protein
VFEISLERKKKENRGILNGMFLVASPCNPVSV